MSREYRNQVKDSDSFTSSGIFIGLPFDGHILPTLSFAGELEKFGRRTTYHLNAEYQHIIESSGYDFQPYYCDTPKPSFAHFLTKPNYLSSLNTLQQTKDVVLQIIRGYSDNTPDYVICDSACPWGGILAKILSVPLITTHTTYINDAYSYRAVQPEYIKQLPHKSQQYFREVFTEYQKIYKYFDLGTFSYRDSLIYDGDAVIVFIPLWFNPDLTNRNDNLHFVGPSLFRGRKTSGHDQMLIDLNMNKKNILYVSLGTIFDDCTTVLLQCIEAFINDSDWHIIVSAGRSYEALKDKFSSQNISVHESVEQLDVLAYTSVFISHGGMNSIMEALSSGVPLVFIPFSEEQAFNARRATRLGFGYSVNWKGLTTEKIRETVLRVATNRVCSDQLKKVSEHMTHTNGALKGAQIVNNVLAS